MGGFFIVLGPILLGEFFRENRCQIYFSETKNTPLERLKTPVSRMLEAINDGMGLNAACRTFHVGKNTIKRWVSRLGGLKESLLLYALCQQFIQLLLAYQFHSVSR
jgi:hypothetical protein